ncbi:MAG: hypothetical protein JW963_12295 [Anaerolineales bacterium]|nr:hypothetical protein [Anaerolineales bacterium]
MNPKFRFRLKLLSVFLTGSLLLSACNPTPTSTVSPTPTVFSETGEVFPRLVSPTPVLTAEVAGTEVTFGVLTLVVPSGVASGANGSDSPRLDNEDAAWWKKTPGHQQVMLGDYYILQGRFHQPQIYVYPAQAYAEMVPTAFESIHRLNNILSNPGAQIAVEQLPVVPFFNAQPVFAANIKTFSFQNGAGVRFLTQYAQSPAPVNNHELFYHFQGLTSDGAYYILAIFPITVPGLAETPAEAAILPLAGIVYPDMTAPNADMQPYYTAATNQLNGTSPDAFSPSLNQLDLLIESLKIADSNSGWPAEISWETAILILNTGRVIEVVQSHNLDITLTLADGNQIKTIEPALDDIFREVERCGYICSAISLITE